jgi:hypothetical protein
LPASKIQDHRLGAIERITVLRRTIYMVFVPRPMSNPAVFQWRFFGEQIIEQGASNKK